jgi:hypothetical protein
MCLTVEELKEKLEQIDEVTLLERLEINSSMIVQAFEDQIIKQYEELAEEFSDGRSLWD